MTGRGSGKRAYELLLDALFRLRSTTILTTIEAGEIKERRGFGWIETFRIIERKTRSGQEGDGRLRDRASTTGCSGRSSRTAGC